jgi:hypothetical protein
MDFYAYAVCMEERVGDGKSDSVWTSLRLVD